MGCELGRDVAGADVQGYDWGSEIAIWDNNVSLEKLCFAQLKQFFLTKNSLYETGSRRRSLRFHGRRLVIFPRRIVGARLSHLHDIAAVTAPLHFDVARIIRYSAQDAHFRVCHLAGVSVRKPTIFYAIAREVVLFLSQICTTEFFDGSIGFQRVFLKYRKQNEYTELLGDNSLEKGTVVGNYVRGKGRRC